MYRYEVHRHRRVYDGELEQCINSHVQNGGRLVQVDRDRPDEVTVIIEYPITVKNSFVTPQAKF